MTEENLGQDSSLRVSELDIPEHVRTDFVDSGITELNPPQKNAVENGLLEGRDMVIASPTASGKTLIAELALSKQVVENDKKAIYIVPLKALASEKYQDFQERYSELDVRMAVGNKDEAGERFETADVVVATSEKLDSMLRHNPSWIHDIGLVVVDEIHLLTSPNRGPTLEVTISRLRELLDFQMLGLSATISNSDELADWLDAELVESDYRPVELKHGVYWQNEIEFYPEGIEIDIEEDEEEDEELSFSTGKEIIEEEDEQEEGKSVESEIYSLNKDNGRGTLNIIEDTFEMDKQAIVFCSSRKGAEKSADRSAKLIKDKISREDRNELKEYSERILNVLGSPTSQCKRLAESVKKGTAFHHAGLLNQQRQLVEEAFREGLIKTISATPTLAAGVNLPAFRVVIRDLKRYTGQGMDFIPVLEYEQMTGRAGRPKYDDRGEAISIAKQPGMKDDILERYILGEPEKLQSKLAVEPVLRMHTLSLVASKFCNDMEQLLEFYSKTLYAHQFGDMKEVENKIRGVVESLREWDFLKDNMLEATNVGERVSELYLDPDSAHLMLESLKEADEKDNKPVSYLFMISRTTEMKPRLRVKDKEYSDIGQAMADAEKYILEPVPNEWEPGFDSFLESMKTAMMLQGWISEIDEERLMDKYGIAPGGVRAKTQNADWLLYGAQELSRMKGFDVQKDIEKLRVRLKHGIEEDLLNLVEYDQIGRVRARELYDHGIRDREEIRNVSFEKLKKLIGKKTARKLKKQVGEENIFDRENITDYF